MKKFILVFMVIFAMSAYSQSTHTINFEPSGVGADWDWTVGDNGTNPPLEFPANPAIGGINTSATVAKFTALQTGAQWALCFTNDDGQFTFDATNTTVKIMVYKSVTSPVAIKFEGLSPAVEIQVPNTLINQWQELTFNFSAHIGKTYNRIVIIPDFAARTENHIIYFDNIQVPDGEEVGPLPEPTTVPPVPAHAVADVISIYSEAYTNLSGTNFNPPWGQSTTVTVDYIAAGNKTLKYENLNYQGTQYTNQDVSLFEFLHVDFWTPNATTLSFFLISPGNEIAFPLTITNQTWVSVDIPLSAFVPPVNLANVFQFKVVGNGTVYFDNWYFWKEPIAQGTDATLSDLKVSGTTVPGFSPLVLNYEIELPNGTTVVPGVTATTNDPEANFVIINAFSLPGTTSVFVTAQDGVTTLTYSVHFTIASPEPTTAPPLPDHPAADVKSFYSEAYTNVEGINFNPVWGQQTLVTLNYSIAGNNTLRYENLNFQGTEFPTQDVSTYEFFHVDFWTANSTALSFFLISPGPVQQEFALTIEPETWVSVDIDLSEFSPPVNLADVFQFKVEGNGDVYFDNWYFWRNPVNPQADATLSDLLIDGTTVEGFSPSVLSYAVELPFGTTEVPAVTAVTNNPNANYIITNATTLPGTANVVVTSEDGTTSLTYVIDFTVGPETPLSEYCETEVWHFNNPAEVASAIFLTITNVDASSMMVEIQSANDDPVDLLLVPGGSGATVSEENFSVPGKISRTLTWADTPPTDVILNVLWSKESFEGNWQLSQGDVTVPFEASCSGGSPTVTFYPQNGATHVAVTVNPKLSFSLPVTMADGSEITNADIASIVSFKVEDAAGANVPFTGTIDEAKKLITLDPDADLEMGQDYYVALNNEVIMFQDAELIPGQSAIFSTVPAPKPYLAVNVQDNFEDNGYATVANWKFQDGETPIDLPVIIGPVNAENHVANYERSGVFAYTNAQVELDHRMNLTSRRKFELKVFFPSSNNYTGGLTPTAAIKLQNSLLGANAWTTQTEIVKTITQFDQWVTLVFNFLTAIDSVNYDQIVVQLGGEGHLIPGQFYFDDLKLQNLPQGIEADFSATPRSGFAPLTVQFNDLSTGTGTPSAWEWDFNGDAIIDSHLKNPIYTYETPGTYSVYLHAYNPFQSDDILKTDYIQVDELAVPAYVYTDFDDNVNTEFSGWPNNPEMVANPDPSGINTSANVGMWSKSVEPNANIYTVLDSTINFADSHIFILSVYAPVTGQALLKLESTANAALNSQRFATINVVDHWQMLVFDFEGEASDVYDKISIFLDFGSATDNIFYFDDVKGPKPDGLPLYKPLLALDVQDNFENDGYATIDQWNYEDPSLVPLTIVADPLNAENHVGEYNRSGSFAYTNAQFILDHRMDLSGRNQFEMKVYFPSSNDYTGGLTPTAEVKLQNSMKGPNAYLSQSVYSVTVEDFDQWVNLHFDFSAVSDSIYYDQVIVQLGGEGHLVPGLFYFDDFVLLDEAILSQQLVQLNEGWSGISSYVVPDNASIEGLFGSLENLEIIVGDNGIYFPSQGINTIGNWDSESGYIIKMTAPGEITFQGTGLASASIMLPQGWSIVPVSVACEVDIASLTGISGQLVMIKEIAGLGVYWPEENVNTLGTLIPGKAYYFLTSDAATLTFPDCISK